MRVARIATLGLFAASAAWGQAPVVAGDSVRVTLDGQPAKLGRVAAVAGDTLHLSDGSSVRLSAVRQVEVGRSKEPDRMRQIAFAAVGAAMGLSVIFLAEQAGCDCSALQTNAFVGGAAAGAFLGGRRRQTLWSVAFTRGDSVHAAARTPAPGPAATPAAFARFRQGAPIVIWRDTARLESAFASVDERLLNVKTAAIPLVEIDVVERRVDRTLPYALIGAVTVGLLGAAVENLDCGLGGSCNDYPGAIATGAAIGLVLGGFVGSRASSWKVEFSRFR